jgi:hypothetical protein
MQRDQEGYGSRVFFSEEVDGMGGKVIPQQSMFFFNVFPSSASTAEVSEFLDYYFRLMQFYCIYINL